ncbi:nucleoside triphosphate pyrophosphohydrolase [Leucobacter sp. Psy1]|uniref:MazG nucleotide pyrophosphohydrolase domain-containing protein n=1 Tax=Leucobacter sp. Psy1 TaxID=2875729 RepID=UPI001CD42285|nr:MazG nucleotide pyrophosphohydrolase domain-containing protein [Leucobacter sp. Psy1]UBH06834.1 nucleoside triphosphate pyrophosphohydrolase [Leucobacter sp. Psy1]
MDTSDDGGNGAVVEQDAPEGLEQVDRPSAEGGTDPLQRVVETVRRLVWPGGCAWHEAQTHESLTPYLVEESAEFIDAVERQQPAGEVRGELGDVLYQVLFHAAIAERDDEGYDLQSVADALDEKLRARHPHVFGDRGHMTVEELNAEWQQLKEDAAGESRGSRGALDGIPAGMPTLARAAKVVERLKRARLINPDEAVGVDRDPLSAALGPDAERIAEVGIGDALLNLVTRANAAGVDPDRALRGAVDRLAARVLHQEG